MAPNYSRRNVLRYCGVSLGLGTAGCLERIPSTQNENELNDTAEKPNKTTREFPVDDLSVQNERSEAVEVAVSVTKNSESVLEETFTLTPDETKTYEDVMANEREYEITVRADGLTKTESFDEHRDNAGIIFSVKSEKIETVRIVH